MGKFYYAFAKYMIYSDMWEIEVNPSKSDECPISNHRLAFRDLTNSFDEYSNRSLTKGVFGEGRVKSCQFQHSRPEDIPEDPVIPS